MIAPRLKSGSVFKASRISSSRLAAYQGTTRWRRAIFMVGDILVAAGRPPGAVQRARARPLNFRRLRADTVTWHGRPHFDDSGGHERLPAPARRDPAVRAEH